MRNFVLPSVCVGRHGKEKETLQTRNGTRHNNEKGKEHTHPRGDRREKGKRGQAREKHKKHKQGTRSKEQY